MGIWYNNSQLLSYNAILNFIIGNRGGGKSYNAKDWCIRDFIKNGNQFVYVRRYKTELKKIDKFFDDIKEDYPNNKLEVKGKVALIDGKIAGYFIALSTSKQEKSTAYPKVTKIIFDEFLIDKGSLHYLPNEVETFLDLFETIARSRDNVRALFIANAISTINPYFTYFKIRVKPTDKFIKAKDGLIVVEQYKSQEFIEKKKNTRFGKLIEGTKYGNYAIENEYLRDNNSFILPKKPSRSFFMYSFKIDGKEYGVYNCPDDGFYYVDKTFDPSSSRRYALTVDDFEINFLLIKSLKNRVEFKSLIFCLENGLIMFKDLECKEAIYSISGYFTN